MTTLRLRREKLQWLVADGDVVALDEATLKYLGANESAALLWQALAVGTTRSQLVEDLVETYGIAHQQAESDVERFLDQLDERGLLEK